MFFILASMPMAPSGGESEPAKFWKHSGKIRRRELSTSGSNRRLNSVKLPMSVDRSGAYDSGPSQYSGWINLIYEGMMAQATEPRMDQSTQQSGMRLRLGAILLGAIVALQAVASVALAGNVWP